MSDFENLKQFVRTLSDQSHGCAQYLYTADQQIGTMINTLMQIMEGSNHPSYKQTLEAMSKAIKDLDQASRFLEAAATAGENWAAEQKVLSKTR